MEPFAGFQHGRFRIGQGLLRFHGAIAQHMGQHHGVGKAVGNAVLATELVGDGVNQYQLWLGGTPNLTRLAEPYLEKMPFLVYRFSAGVVGTLIAMLIAFILGQKQIVKGVVQGAIK